MAQTIPENWLPGGAYYEEVLKKFRNDELDYHFKDIPVDVLDEALAFAWVSHGLGNILDIPDHLKTREVCRAAITRHRSSFNGIPKHMLDKDICKIAVQNGVPLVSIPLEYLDEEMCLWNIRAYRQASLLGQVPMAFRTERVCIEAYRYGSTAMRYIPTNLQIAVWEFGANEYFKEHWDRRISTGTSIVRNFYGGSSDVVVSPIHQTASIIYP